MTGIYIHVPFCLKRCGYCDFCSSIYNEDKIRRYKDALVRNIRDFACKGIEVDTVYLGGGTPSLLSADMMSEILDVLRQNFVIDKRAEITVEANPGTVDPEKLRAYALAGVNRISFGVQSCKDDELYRLGRIHSFKEAAEAVMMAKKSGIENISCDLMLGIPGQTLKSARESAESLCGLGIDHLSAYMLKIEEGTPFDCPEIKSAVADDDEVSEMYLECAEILERCGLMQYEISNFAKPGFESRHNLKYWKGEPYIGFGASAHSFFMGKRFYVPPDIDGFISAPTQNYEAEDLSPDALTEYILLGLRLTEGIALERVDSLGGSAEKLILAAKPFEAAEYLDVSGGRVRLTRVGFLVSNGIILRLTESQQ